MSRRVQAFDGRGRRVFLWGSLRAVCACLLAAGVAGCAVRGNAIDQFMADETLITGSVSSASPITDHTLLSDKATIRNAVISAVVGEIPAEGLEWANAETGSRGVIRDMEQVQIDGESCRQFVATRESFAGVHLYRGRACLWPGRPWALLAFDQV